MHLLLPGSQIVVWHFVVGCFAFVLHCHTIPATDQEEDINSMDYATLQSRQIVALETVQELTARLAKAQDFFGRITKRLKTMQECQEPPTPPAYPVEDIEMEGMD